MKVEYSEEYEDIIFGLRFLRTEIDFVPVKTSGISVDIDQVSVLQPVLLKIRDEISESWVKDVYFTEKVIQRVIKSRLSPNLFNMITLKSIDTDSENYTFFDTVMFAEAYKYRLEGKKINEKDVLIFEKVQERFLKVLDFEVFDKLYFRNGDIRVGRIDEISVHPESEKLFIEKVNFGYKESTILSGLRKNYRSDELINRSFLFLVNMKSMKIAGLVSEGMILCGSEESVVEAIEVGSEIELGSKLDVESDKIAVIKEYNCVSITKKKTMLSDYLELLKITDGYLSYNGRKVTCNSKYLICQKVKNGPVG